ncbi:hypothetical protein [Metabacillus niabensis]|uniref:Uncharacterized protein n=1 Tax=Metabacillus niabensis TaxID=324854 RepID=A0ABT9Z2W4_9BACI|nr:hypothetical protein [Metabacillus niabensis]MDQ0226603.1 hypothetical protein [Metabacillus niabensis]
MTIGSKVYYKNEMYKVIYIYNTGMCEIKKLGLNNKVELVQLTDITYKLQSIS